MTLVETAVATSQMDLDLEELASAENVLRFYQDGGMTHSAGQVTVAAREARWTTIVARLKENIATNVRRLP